MVVDRCPVCGQDIEFADKAAYCPHILFIYIWGGDPDFWVYVKPGFAEQYMACLRANPAVLNNDWIDEDGENPALNEEIQSNFASGKFQPMDEISTAIPYDEDLVISTMAKSVVLLKDEGSYSGYIIGYTNEP